jgi:glycine/D-amino acid oxidase-like deaminating enzyme
MNFFVGLISGIAASLGYAGLAKRLFRDPDRPPWISEYYVRSIWLELAGFYDLSANPPFTENDARAEIVIVGGGLTGLSAAYHLKKRFPDKRIVLLEAARCGYGASGRNGGILQDFDNSLIMDIYQKKGRNAARRYFKIDRQGPILVRKLIKEHRIDCDLEESGLIELALDPDDMQRLIKYHDNWKSLGIESRIMNREELRHEIISERYCGGLHKERCAVLNPAKFALGLKSVLETLGVEIFECTKVVSIQPGSTIKIETEFGNITSDAIVLATNAYSHRIGFFKNRIFPMATYIMATEPLREDQMSSIGWSCVKIRCPPSAGQADIRCSISVARVTIFGLQAITVLYLGAAYHLISTTMRSAAATTDHLWIDWNLISLMFGRNSRMSELPTGGAEHWL